ALCPPLGEPGRGREPAPPGRPDQRWRGARHADRPAVRHHGGRVPVRRLSRRYNVEGPAHVRPGRRRRRLRSLALARDAAHSRRDRRRAHRRAPAHAPSPAPAPLGRTSSVNREGSMSLKDKTVVVTGATRGIGKAMAMHLAAEGARVAAVGRSVERGERVVADIGAAGGDAAFIRCDVSVEHEVASLFDEVTRRYGAIDVVVNNAAATDVATRDRPVVEQTTEDFEHFVRSGLYSVFWSFKYGIPAMGPGGGAFVTIS